MHRQNTYQGNSGGSWSTVGGDASGSTRPKHLRGKQIGLYYRDKAMRGRSQGQAKLPPEVFQAEKERRKRIRSAITLRIPPKVLDTMNKNLESIEKVAQGLNITILPVKGLEEIKARTKVKDSSKNMNTSFSEDNDSNVDWFLDGETAKDIDPDNVNNKEEDVNDFWETSSVEEDVMWNISSDFEEHKSQKKPKITGPDGRSTDLTGDHDTPSRCETNVDQNDADSKKSEILMKADVFKKPKMVLKTPAKKDIGQSSTSLDFIPVDTESPQDYGSAERLYSLRGGGDYKYGYHDIITGTFDEKLDECLAKGIAINTSTDEIKDLNVALYEDYKNMQTRERFRKMMKFREMLPTYKKTQELLDVITNNQVVVISGETGCGKSTQVPQIILDDAICKNKGGNCKIVVTQPRRIAASSLAKRVSEERGERIGESVGYAVRLEKKDPRPRGSIFFVTTGILLADLEVNQGLTNYSHVILDEVHERDCHIDLSMCLLKKVLRKRKDLKLILMSATIDADTLSRYFDDCPMMHIEGLAYPVKDVYLEEILQMTGFELPEDKKPKQHKGHRGKWKRRRGHNDDIAQEVQYRAEVGPWLEAIKHKLDRNVFWTLLDHRIETLNMDLITALLIHICNGPPGAILVFLPGIGDIAKLIRLMGESGKFPENRYQIYSLHSKLPSLEQHRIFERPPGDVRKIIIATNIAETSITIDDIVYVVDCAKIKITGLQVDQNICTLKTEWVSQANLRQRRGRAGRCQPGVCYHVVSSFRATRLEERLLPELQRSNLLEPVLTIKRLRLGKAEDALKTVPSPPDPSTVKWAVQHLQQCGALDESETLTPLGWHLARLPVHPSAGKLLLLGSLFGCLDRAASVAAVWGFKDPFQLVIGKEAEVEAARRRLALGEPSDQVAISEAVIRWERQGSRQRSFAYEHFLSNNTLELLSEMKHQLGDNLKQMGFLATGDVKSSWENRNADNLSLFKAIVAASLYPNFAMVRWINLHSDGRKQIRCCASDPHSRDKLQIHPSSVMALPPNSFGRKGPIVKLCNNPGANWLVYWLKQRTVDIYLFEVTLVYTLPLLFFGEVKVVEDEDETPETRTEADCVLSISGVKVRCTSRTAELLFRFRSLLDQVLASKVGVESNRATRRCHFEDAVLNAVIELITAEDERAEYLGGNGSESDHSEYEGGSSQSWR